MEDISEILKRIRDSRSANGGSSGEQDTILPVEEPEGTVCSVCDGKLWLAFDAPVGHPDFGKAEPCQCQAQIDPSERATRLRRYSNLGPLARMTFGSATPEGRADDPDSKRLFGAAYEAALIYAESPEGWLVLTGPNGAGKTHLAAAIANYCIERGRPVFFVHVPDLLDDLRSTYSPTSELSYSDLFEQVNDAPLLILDGLGTQSPTPWAQEKLQQIFNRRANAELPTVVTTAEDVHEIDPYIGSRMLNQDLSRVLEIRRGGNEQTKRLGPIPPEMLRNMTFDTFSTRGNSAGNAASYEQQKNLRIALQDARKWASSPSGWLTLWGGIGVGKTHLAVAIAGEQLKKGVPVFFAFTPDLMDYLKATFHPSSGVAYDRVFDNIRNAPMLILDDLGVEHRSGWVYEKLLQLIVHRHNLRLPTVFTTNLKILNVSGPIASRVRDGAITTLINIETPDYRLKEPPRGWNISPEDRPRRSGRFN